MQLTDVSLVDWSRAQFALTAIYHWLFVPLTLGLSFIMAFTESIYVKTGNEEWKKITKFWMTLFGINFAIGAATGIILEFEFGTNWSNYSWIVGDIFGAPLAIEGIMAFFIESTFIALMFFGWSKVGKKTHLLSTWLVAIGSNLSALWILVANSWMNFPSGMHFNPDTARSEMLNFWDVALSPVAVNKFIHTITSSYAVASLFVVGISSWFLLKKKHESFAIKSIIVGAVFGLLSTLFLAFTGDDSAYQIAQKQPMKLAAMEGLYDGKTNAGLVAIGILNHDKKAGDTLDEYKYKVEIPNLLSLLGYRDKNAFVPGINDLVYGNPLQEIEPVSKRMERGTTAIISLAKYKEAKEKQDETLIISSLKEFQQNYKDIGYGYLDKPEDIIPNVPLIFYSFRVMVGLGIYFLILFLFILYFAIRKTIDKKRWLLRISLFSIPLGYLASELGWVVAEVGRQPWAIQDILPVSKATSHLNTSAVQITFVLFAVLFTILLIAELRILLKQIKVGPKE
jgi:cytochrome bd ubiquinol oxidase subunit I